MAETSLGKQLQQFVDDLERAVLDAQKMLATFKGLRENLKDIRSPDTGEKDSE